MCFFSFFCSKKFHLIFFCSIIKKYSQQKNLFYKKFRFINLFYFICEIKLDEFLLFLAEKTHKKVSNLSCLKNKNNNSI